MPFKISRYINIFLVPRLLRLINRLQTEILFFDQPWFGWLMFLLKVFSRKKIFIRSNNIEYLRFKSMGIWFWQMLYIYEKWTYRIADLVIFVSETDRQKAIYEFDLKEEKTMLVPYGVEILSPPSKNPANRKFLEETYSIKSSEKILLFFATMSYAPNYEAVGFIADDIYPLLKQQTLFDFKILICGKKLPQHILDKLGNKPEITYCGFVDDINAYIDGSDVMINPILSGGGVKTKAIDTLAMNQTVVSTKTGAEGVDPAVCGNQLMITPDYDWKAFVSAITTALETTSTIPDDFYKTYSWSNIIDSLSVRLETI
jgi:glycosyltransferase involved in cell wall biosynthesis